MKEVYKVFVITVLAFIAVFTILVAIAEVHDNAFSNNGKIAYYEEATRKTSDFTGYKYIGSFDGTVCDYEIEERCQSVFADPIAVDFAVRRQELVSDYGGLKLMVARINYKRMINDQQMENVHETVMYYLIEK